MKKYGLVFYVSLAVSLLFLGFGAVFPKKLEYFSNTFLSFIYDKLGWLFLLTVFILLVFCVFIAFSRFGKVKLGQDADVPEYNRVTWIAMLFSAGIGISLVFWGVAEPVSYYVNPPFGEGSTQESAENAMQFVYLHWGVSAWAVYAFVGACLAYFQFRKRLPATMSSAFYPVIGDRIYGPIGKTINIIVVLSVVVGISTSLGFGVLQINSGMAYQWDLVNNTTMQMVIIGVVTLIYLWSASTGIQRGIKYLSNTNIILAFILLLSIFALGPTQQIMKIFFQGMGDYANNFLNMSFRTNPYGDGSWIANWTLFYFGWWIAWAPLVGSFVARISKGRTLKEFMMGALFIPVLCSFFWFAVLGGSALDLIQNQGYTALATTVTNDVTVALFDFISYFPLSGVISIVGMVLIFTFFITSADSAMFVLGMMSENGNQNPKNFTKLTWGIIVGLVSAILIVTGGLAGLQSALVAMGVPLAILLLSMCYGFYKGLQQDSQIKSHSKRAGKKNVG
ncbi:MAG TPA: BCCT family transporter [Lentibacillus sp.]|uniref:BCCT family transporter n=1 Tax=Lentibacillus sp. TaxID=1925746 RepID=UPI002B4B0D8F|nr:BCCT family transporter [Lentibacillus sp.]HLR63793.1 BCCT family transporter [Lentibacillus sp.]